MKLILLAISILVQTQDRPAALSGAATDGAGAVIVGANAELRSDNGRLYQTVTDRQGLYHFPTVLPGSYTLKLSARGFYSVTIRSIDLGDGELRTISAVSLPLSPSGCIQPYPVADYFRLFPADSSTGNLIGFVSLDADSKTGKTWPVADAEVSLICTGGALCGKTKTDSRGEFAFSQLLPGSFSIDVKHAGFYPSKRADYQVFAGLEGVWPIPIETCPLGNCNVKLRSRKPLIACE